MNWCFATINGRLGEIYFEKTRIGKTKFLGHCYIGEKELKTKTKEELRWIDADTRKGRIVYRNKKYKLVAKDINASKKIVVKLSDG